MQEEVNETKEFETRSVIAVGNEQIERATAGLRADNRTQTEKSYASKLQVLTLDGFRRRNHLVDLMRRPIAFLLFPIISYAGFSYGCSAIWLAFLNATESAVFSGPPYMFSTSIVGVTFVSPLVGTTLA